MRTVRKFLEFKHKGRYMVFNLCAEKEYDPANFEGLSLNHIPKPSPLHEYPICMYVDACMWIYECMWIYVYMWIYDVYLLIYMMYICVYICFCSL
jgi:hypothetical protein